MTDNKETTIDRMIEEIMASPGAPSSLQPGELDAAAQSLGARSATQLTEELELAAAALMLANLRQEDVQPMPSGLRDRIAAQGAKSLAVPSSGNVTPIGARQKPATSEGARGNRWFAGLGWAAAAALLIALVIQPTRTIVDTQPPDSSELRSQLLQQPDSISVPWGDSEIAQFAGVSGDVVWNNDTQQGYLRLVGMPANDPSEAQYQLWIVDPERDDNPIDGGVFNVAAAGGEVLIPIDAKLEVLSPAAFAITREKPGGVVVSEGPLLLVAAT